MKILEDFIWNAITDSAKQKIDFKSLEESLPIADMFLFQIIVDLASDKSKETIGGVLYNELMTIGYNWPIDDLVIYIDEIEKNIHIEVGIAKLASDMLRDGIPVESVLTFVTTTL